MEFEKFPDPRGKLVAFDLDGTLVEGDLGEAVFFILIIMQSLNYSFDDLDRIFEQLTPNNTFSGIDDKKLAQTLASYNSFLEDNRFNDAYKITAEYYLQFPKDEVFQLTHRVLKEGLNHLCVNLQIGADTFLLKFHIKRDLKMSALLNDLYRNGAKLMIISASPQWSVEAFCAFEGVPTEIAHGAKRVNGNTCVPFGSSKLDVLRSQGDIHPFMVFGNGMGDMEMLEAAVHPFVRVNSQRQVLEKANRCSWQII